MGRRDLGRGDRPGAHRKRAAGSGERQRRWRRCAEPLVRRAATLGHYWDRAGRSPATRLPAAPQEGGAYLAGGASGALPRSLPDTAPAAWYCRGCAAGSQNRDSQSTCAGTRGRALRARRAWRAPWLKGLPGLTKTPRRFSFDVSPAGSSDRCGRLKVVVGSLRPVRSTNHIQGGGNMTGEG